MISIGGMKKLRILSIGRNVLKRIEKLEEVAETLEELWCSYNQIATLEGVKVLKNLTTLYISNNKIKNWAEIGSLQACPKLSSVNFFGNPIYEGEKRGFHVALFYSTHESPSP
jgi:dynein light chain 1